MADNLATFTCQLPTNSGSLQLLETSGPAQACKGISLPFLCLVTLSCKGYRPRFDIIYIKISYILPVFLILQDGIYVEMNSISHTHLIIIIIIRVSPTKMTKCFSTFN